MQHNLSGDSLDTGYDTSSQSNIANETLRIARALLSQGQRSAATEALTRALDGAQIPAQFVRAPLALLLARLLASQGHLAAAEECLMPVLEYVDDRRIAAHILCARAIELASLGDVAYALALTTRARELAHIDAEIVARTDELYTVLVPAKMLAGAKPGEVSDELVTRVVQILVQRFKAAPNNVQIAHVIALLVERYSTRADIQTLRDVLKAAEQGRARSSYQGTQQNDQLEMWDWAIRCWVLLAFTEGYWQRWYRHLVESRGESASDDIEPHAVGKASLQRIRRLHEHLRDLYGREGSPLYNPPLAKKHERYLVALETEYKSARVLTALMISASEQLRVSGFVGPAAGIGLLAAIGRSAPIRQFVLQQSPQTRVGGPDATSEAIERLRQCLSPFSPMYTMHDLGWAEKAEAYCRKLAAHHLEPRQFLLTLLHLKAQAAFQGNSLDDARKSCVEAMRLSRGSHEMQEIVELFAAVSERRVQLALDAHRTNFAEPLALAREDLVEAPDDERLKAGVAHVLRMHAQHVRDLLGDSTWSVSDARRIWALQNEAWQLDPDPEVAEWTLWASVQLVIALTNDNDIEKTTASALREAETVVSTAEGMFAGNILVQGLRVALLRTRVSWHLFKDERVALVRGNTHQIEALASQVERVWGLDRERDDGLQQWVAFCFAELARACLSDDEGSATLAPYETGLTLVARGLRLVPGSPALTATQAELVRLKATAIIEREGGFDGTTLTSAVRETVLGLFAQSWSLDSSSADRALAMGRVCALIGQNSQAEWYALAATRLESANREARDLWALMRAQPAYEAASRDSDYAEQLINQRRYRDAVAYLARAEQTLARAGYNPAWEAFIELHGVIRHNLDVLRRSGY